VAPDLFVFYFSRTAEPVAAGRELRRPRPAPDRLWRYAARVSRPRRQIANVQSQERVRRFSFPGRKEAHGSTVRKKRTRPDRAGGPATCSAVVRCCSTLPSGRARGRVGVGVDVIGARRRCAQPPNAPPRDAGRVRPCRSTRQALLRGDARMRRVAIHPRPPSTVPAPPGVLARILPCATAVLAPGRGSRPRGDGPVRRRRIAGRGLRAQARLSGVHASGVRRAAAARSWVSPPARAGFISRRRDPPPHLATRGAALQGMRRCGPPRYGTLTLAHMVPLSPPASYA